MQRAARIYPRVRQGMRCWTVSPCRYPGLAKPHSFSIRRERCGLFVLLGKAGFIIIQLVRIHPIPFGHGFCRHYVSEELDCLGEASLTLRYGSSHSMLNGPSYPIRHSGLLGYVRRCRLQSHGCHGVLLNPTLRPTTVRACWPPLIRVPSVVLSVRSSEVFASMDW